MTPEVKTLTPGTPALKGPSVTQRQRYMHSSKGSIQEPFSGWHFSTVVRATTQAPGLPPLGTGLGAYVLEY